MPYRNLTSEQLDAVKFDGNLLLQLVEVQEKQNIGFQTLFILENKELFDIGKKKKLWHWHTLMLQQILFSKELFHMV